jgi:hypothetical protein
LAAIGVLTWKKEAAETLKEPIKHFDDDVVVPGQDDGVVFDEVYDGDSAFEFEFGGFERVRFEEEHDIVTGAQRDAIEGRARLEVESRPEVIERGFGQVTFGNREHAEVGCVGPRGGAWGGDKARFRVSIQMKLDVVAVVPLVW